MKYLHIWYATTMDSRGDGFMKNIRRFYPEDQHYLYLKASPSEYYQLENGKPLENGAVNQRGEYVWYERPDMKKSERRNQFAAAVEASDFIVAHGPSMDFYQEYRILNAAAKPMSWLIWGHEATGDYEAAHKIFWKHPLRTLQYHLLEREKVKFMHSIIAYAGEVQECDNAYDHYQCSGQKVIYNYGGYADLEIPEFPEEISDGKTRVLIGHNAFPNCRHIDAMERLKPLDDGKLIVVCPLIYDQSEEMPALVREVSERGRELFGERFEPLYDEMDYLSYCRYLWKVDIVLFNHDRQMAQGNIEKLLYYGKKLYLAKENTDLGMYTDLGAVMYDICVMDEQAKQNPQAFFEPLSEDARAINRKIIEDELDPETFMAGWDPMLGKK